MKPAALALVLTCACATAPAPLPAPAGYHVRRFLHDRCGERVILRGVNHPTLYVDRAGDALPEIAKTGANAVRLFWAATHGIPISVAAPAVERSIANGLIPILELHDSSGIWALPPLVAYWTSAEARAFIARFAAHLIVNLANEATPPSPAEFTRGYAQAIRALRAAGITTPIMIDGGRLGRDYEVLLAEGPALLRADPAHNLIFSAHLYDPLSEPAIAAIFARSIALDLPFVVGEFANRQPPGCGAPLDYRAIIRQAHRHEIGWLAWSWGDDRRGHAWNEDCAEFDMADTFAADSLLGWGREVALSAPESLRNTARRPRSLDSGRCGD